MNELQLRSERKFEFGGFLLSHWHLESSRFGRVVSDLSVGDGYVWTLFEVRDLANRGLADRLMLSCYGELAGDEEFYFVDDREDACDLIVGSGAERGSIYVSEAIEVEIR